MSQAVAVVGASGFIGSAVCAALTARGAVVTTVSAPRLAHTNEHDASTDLATDLAGCEVVVNAAGISDALSSSEKELQAANARLPGVIADAALRAGARLMVQVSSAAVQGDRPILDSDPVTTPLSAYARSKADGEAAVTSAPIRTVIYRPPGVHAPQRRVTQQIVRIATSPLSSVAGPGDRPTANALLPNVADAIAFLALHDDPPPLVHHPAEGITTAELLRMLGSGRSPHQIPERPARAAITILNVPPLNALRATSRRLEMLWFGQLQADSWLTTAGWRPLVDLGGWPGLAQQGTPAVDPPRSPAVLLIAHQYWPTPGSATQVLDALTRALRETGASVDVITTRPAAEYEAVTRGPHGERIHYAAGVERSGAGLTRVARLAEFAQGVLTVSRGLTYDVVISDPPPTAAWAARKAARRAGAPFVYYFADTWGGATGDARAPLARLAHRPVQALENALLASADAVVPVTDQLREVAIGAGARRVELVRNGVPTDRFTPDGPTWVPDRSGEPFFLYAGNAGVVHGATVFAAASEQLWSAGRLFRTVYMGYGADSGEISAVATRWPGRLLILGNQPPEIVAAAFRASTGALSSLRPFDSYQGARPIKSMTGLACGSPAVYAGDAGFAQELKDNGLGFVAEWSVDGARRVMEAALEAARDEDAFTELRSHCVRYAREHYDSAAGARRVAELVINLVKKEIPA